DVGAAGSVLVVALVAVVVPAFHDEREAAGLALLPIGAAEERGLERIGHPLSSRIGGPHHRDQAVAVQIVGAVLAGGVVAIVVGGSVVARPFDRRRPEQRFGGVGIGAGDQVEGDPVEQPGDGGVAAVAGGQGGG